MKIVELLNKVVEVTYTNGAVLTGTIIDVNEEGNVGYIQSSEDVHMFTEGKSEVVEVKSIREVSYTEQFEKALAKGGYDNYESIRESDMTTYIIEGVTYRVNVAILDSGVHTCETQHIERADADAEDDAWANFAERKTISGVMAYVARWCNK